MPLTERTIEHVTILDLDQVLTYASGAELRAWLEATGPRAVNLVLNMTAVSYIDSAGLGAMIDAYTEVARRGGTMKLLHLNPRARHLLDITGLAGIIGAFDSETAALDSFTPGLRIGEATS